MAKLLHLTLRNFRNYSSSRISLGPKLNLFVGANGQGKTNCLEAIALLISGKSFRTSFLKEMIKEGESSFGLKAVFERFGIEQTLHLEYGEKSKKLIHNHTTYSSFLPLIGLLQGVYFSSFQNAFVRGSPGFRRRFLDLQSSQVDPLYLHHLKRYQTALKERNALLRHKSFKSLEIYEQLLSQSAPYLVTQRQNALKELASLAQTHMHELTQSKETLQLNYALSTSDPLLHYSSDEFMALYEKHRAKDLKLGYTSIGPHKDDISIYLKNTDAKKFASEGQVQSLVSSLYLGEYERLENKTQDTPLFCVDDIAQSLDFNRLKRLFQKLENLGQVFITTPEIPNYPFPKETKIFKVKEGSFEPLA